MSENNSELGAFLAGFVIGGLVGAATALILAPQSGSDTRSQISDQGQNLRSGGEERISSMRNTASGLTNDYRDRAGKLASTVREKAQESGGNLQQQARVVLDSGKEQTGKMRQRIDRLVRKSDNDIVEGDIPAEN